MEKKILWLWEANIHIWLQKHALQIQKTNISLEINWFIIELARFQRARKPWNVQERMAKIFAMFALFLQEFLFRRLDYPLGSKLFEDQT